MLTRNQINVIIEVLKPYNPKRIGLFGSVARNEETLNSDIDILYDFNSPITLFHLAEMKNKLTEKLKKKIDLVSANAIDHKIKEYILTDLKVIYEG